MRNRERSNGSTDGERRLRRRRGRCVNLRNGIHCRSPQKLLTFWPEGIGVYEEGFDETKSPNRGADEEEEEESFPLPRCRRRRVSILFAAVGPLSFNKIMESPPLFWNLSNPPSAVSRKIGMKEWRGS